MERELRVSDVVGSLQKAASSCQGLMGVAVSSLARLSFHFSLNKISCDRSKRQLGASERSTSSWFACCFARARFVPVAFPLAATQALAPRRADLCSSVYSCTVTFQPPAS